MNNDLISREALKKAFENLASDDYNEPIWYQQTVFETINNAPTVDFEKLGESLRCQIRAEYGSCDDCELSCPRNELINLLNLERPHGTWLYTPNIPNLSEYEGITCSICGNDSIGDFNFCPHCGADMRGDTHEQ